MSYFSTSKVFIKEVNTVATDLRTPYDHAKEAGYEDQMEDVRDVLKGDDWVTLSMKCTPKTLAAGAVYYLHKTRDDWPDRTQVQVADDFNTTPISVRSGWKHLGIYHGLLDEDEVRLPHE